MKHFVALIIIIIFVTLGGTSNWLKGSFGSFKNRENIFNDSTLETDTIKSVNTNQGIPFITNFNPELSNQEVWSICQDEFGQMIFANRQGLTLFNGLEWERIKLPAVPISLKNLPEKKIILLGCDNQFGYLELNEKGEYEYNPLSDEQLRYGEITDIKLSKKYIFFYSDESLSVYDRKKLELIDEWFVQDGIKQNGIFQFNNDLYISKKKKGVYKINIDGKKEPVPKSDEISNNQVLFSLELSKNKLLIGALANKLYTFDGENFNKYSFSASDYVDESILAGGIDLNNSQFALSTLSGGILILNKKTGRIVNIINYQNGLPDDEIFATSKDKEGGIWLSHGYGISRVNYDLPVKDFNYYPGIEGKLTDIIDYNNTTYVATTEGVFYLDTLKSIEEFEVYVKKSSIKTVLIPKSTTKTDTENEKKKNIFQRWKERRELRKKKKAEEKRKEQLEETKIEEQPEEKSEKNTTSTPEKKKYVYKKKKVRILSVSYVFKKVNGIKGKCRQLVKYKNSVLVASNNGLYEIKKKKAKKVLKNHYINNISPSKTEGLYYIGTEKGFTVIKETKSRWKELKKIQPKEFEDKVLQIVEDDSVLWVGSDALVYHLNIGKNHTVSSFEIYDFERKHPDKYAIRKIKDKIFFLSATQIYHFNTKNEKIEPSDQLLPSNLSYLEYIISQKNITWLKNEERWVFISDNIQLRPDQIALLNLFDNIRNIKVDKHNNIWVIDGRDNLYKILPIEISESYLSNFNVYIQKIQNDKGNYITKSNIEISPGVVSLTFKTNAPYYLRPEKIRYQYFIEGLMNDWSAWKQSPDIDFMLQPGYYKIQVRAKNIFGTTNESKKYFIAVKTPFWIQTWFIVLATAFCSLLVTIIVYIFQKRKAKRFLRYNKELEEKVEKRTTKMKWQKEQIERKNNEITQSLNYASQIQSAILPSEGIIKKVVADSFILNKPKNIVSGDFYWAHRIDDRLVVTAADCTGHGVPGAFLSMLGITFLNEITFKMDILDANTILEILRRRVIKTLHQGGNDRKRRLDGIDLSLVVIDLNTKELQFAGANNPLYFIRDGELTEYKGDSMPVGIQTKTKPFTNNIIDIKPGDLIYMFSDGFMDQFGGKHGRKFLSRNFKELLKEISYIPLEMQKKVLSETLDIWKGQHEQIDDILIVGIRI
jgi:serine phosphatase RsbU (regulator of sigma subunit)/ligand-binding sensor domain-containing protein